MNASPRETFLRLVSGVAAGRFDELPDLYAEQTDVRHPMAVTDAAPMTSRTELRAHFTAPSDEPPPKYTRRPTDIVIHETVDPEVIVAEFSYEFTYPDSGAVAVPCVFVLRVHDGEIIESRDYIDPIRSARARRSLEDLVGALQT